MASQLENEVVDDSWIMNDDKQKLLKHIKYLYTTKFGWADDTLMKSMVAYHYNMTIKKMDKESYLKEKETMTLDDFLEQLG